MLDGEPDPPFWRPSIAELSAELGWRWVLVLPGLVAATLLLGWMVFSPGIGVWSVGSYLLTLLAALGISTGAVAFSRVMKRIREPFCIHCGYPLVGLENHSRCPECGRRFDFAMVAEYRKNPGWFAQRYRLSGRNPGEVRAER
jgi:hypothetical protein